MSHHYRCPLRWGDMDAQGHLNNAAFVDYLQEARVDYLLGGPAAMPGREPWDYYGTERSASPGWANRLTALTVRELITVDLAVGADFLGPTPLLVVHGTTDAFCSPDGARAVFERTTGHAEIRWLETSNHIDLYDRTDLIPFDRIEAFLTEHLAPVATLA